MKHVLSSACVLAGTLILYVMMGFMMAPVFPAPEATDAMPRRTNIMAGDDLLKELDEKNLTNTNGVVSIDVDTLESPVQIGSTPVYLRDNSGKLEFSNNSTTWHDFTALSDTSATTYTVGNGATSGTVQISFGNHSGFRADLTSTTLEFWDGAAWQPVGSGGDPLALTSADHTNTFLEQTKSGQYTQLDSPTLQISAFANFSSLSTAENILHRLESGYSCSVQRFGKDASNHLVYEVGTTYAETCASSVYTTTATLSATHQDRWVEYALRADHTGDTVTFYVDGQVFDTQAMTATLATQSGANEVLRLYEGWAGSGGAIKIGNLLTWPTSGWKGVDREVQTFPGVVFALPLAHEDTTPTDVIGAEAFAVDGDVSWETIPGGY